jgi:hypothetical protein
VQNIFTGQLRKLIGELADESQDETAAHSPVHYRMPLGDDRVALNPLLGQKLKLEYVGQINCIHCGRLSKKSFNQGYCYPCFTGLAQCDICIMSPEKCHYDKGTCREPAWGEEFCMQDHYVYLANSSGLKVGITRGTQIPTRWIDQGAIQGLPVFRVKNRLHSGLLEVIFKQLTADKTNWRTMLKGQVDELDLLAERDHLLAQAQEDIQALEQQLGLQAVQTLDDAQPLAIDYPVLEYPSKVVSFNLEKTPLIEGTLMGIKGQYLIFDTGVINMRKYAGYQISLSL